MSIIFNPDHPSYSAAFEQVRPLLDAMRAEDVLTIRHDIMSAVIVALGALPTVRVVRELVRARFGEDAARQLDLLEVAAQACGRAHAEHLITLHGADVEEMAGRLSQVKSVLLYEVQALIAAKRLPASVIAELVGGTSYRGLCLDVLQLVTALRRAWAEVEPHTGVTSRELDQAEALGNAFTTVLGENEVGTATSPTAEMRRRAYTLFVRTYSEARRYASYFRWKEGDVDSYMPALGSIATPGRRPSDEGADAPVVPTPNAPISAG